MVGFDFVWGIPLLPLLGSLLCAIAGLLKENKKLVTFFALGSTFISFLLAIWVFIGLFYLPESERVFESSLFVWISSGSFVADASLQVDQLSGLWMLVVTGIGFLIHLYSVGYMIKEDGYYRYFSYLNLFMFSMLILVLGGNFLLMFIGWEGVGLCSYLLIGYYYDTKSASDAGRKAFIMNRVGDFGFIIAIIAIFSVTGSVDYTDVFRSVKDGIFVENTILGFDAATFIAILLFLGAVGKSAQIPLYTWLPDAMEGPTPVSALIHAATMVTAGVYMVARAAPIYDIAPVAMMLVAFIGALTAIFAATIGMWQYDIKRVLAYSTVSQLGYMFLACGVGAYMAAVFHVITHAFFKALLFLGSGSVIHGMSGKQDIREMGGLKSKMPITHATFLIATLAIAGIPPLAGFFSKDEILLETFLGETYGHLLYFAMGTVAAGVTAFYMFRLYYLTFCGDKVRTDDQKIKDHIHESPASMTIPLILLAALALFGGFLGFPFGENWHLIRNFLTPLFNVESADDAHTGMAAVIGIGSSLLLAIIGIFIARYFYLSNLPKALKLARRGGLSNLIYWVVQKKYFIDEIYDALIVEPLLLIYRKFFYKIVDQKIVDGIVNLIAAIFVGIGFAVRTVQTGLTRNYAAFIVAGGVVLVFIWILF